MESGSIAAYPAASYAELSPVGYAEPAESPPREESAAEPPPAAVEVVPYPDSMGQYVNLLV